MADRAGIIRKGRLIAIDEVDELRSRALRQVRIVFDRKVAAADFEGVINVSEVFVDNNVLRCKLVGEADALVKALGSHRVIDLVSEEPQLEELFFHYYTDEDSNAA